MADGDDDRPADLRGLSWPRDGSDASTFPTTGDCRSCPILFAMRRLEREVAVLAPLLLGAEPTDPVIPGAAATPPLPPKRDGLTERQRQVARLLAEGLTDREIAARLHLTVRTARDYASQVLSALGVRSRRHVGEVLLPTNAHGHLPVVGEGNSG